MQGSGAQGLGVAVQGQEFGDSDFRFRVENLGFRVWGLGFGISGSRV